MTTNKVQEALTSHRITVLGVTIAVLSTIIGILVGLQIGKGNVEERAQSAVALYAEASYRACKLQEIAMNGYNSQAARRSCDYLKLPLKQ